MFYEMVNTTVEQFWINLNGYSSVYGPLMLKGSVGDDLEHLEKDRAIRTDPDDTRKRRTIKLIKRNESWGFALQTYGVRNKRSNEIEVMTYVDYVEYNGPAWLAGLQRGDIFLSINGEPVEGATHQQLVDKIRKVGDSMRLVVLFEDCCRKVELYEKFIKLKQVLSAKLTQLQELKIKENAVLKRCGLTRVEELRNSVRSTRSIRSTISSDWDRFSVLGNSMSLRNIPNHVRDRRKYAGNYDSSSDLSVNNSFNDSLSDSESGAFLTSSSVDLTLNTSSRTIDNVDSASEYSLPLHSNFQLGGKLLTFSEDDSVSNSSFEQIESCDTIVDQSDIALEIKADTSDIETVDESQNMKKISHDQEIDQANVSVQTEDDESCDLIVDQSNVITPIEEEESDDEVSQSMDCLVEDDENGSHDLSSGQLSVESCYSSLEGSHDQSCDEPCDDVIPKTVKETKRFKDGILINEDEELTKL
ncbi:uncharacterized protein LOC126831693 isoform X1 [Patella vulgata]|uniref:uncharacterized protein LOC126831693 isoform X1 n=1 Tax=Patella vulgata TaxID=6465 RepID=UPI00217F8F48|nr:uncharacterized protein LOC126831693 isoform X1 [Patella vulgata]